MRNRIRAALTVAALAAPLIAATQNPARHAAQVNDAAKPATPTANKPGATDMACTTPKCISPPFTAGRAAV